MNKSKYFWMKLDGYSVCPCGSGQKFKFCCRNKPYEPSAELEADLALGQELVKEYDASIRKNG
jgi:hypothetical protein